MAISGDISDLPLTDLLNMIRFRGGFVTLTDTPRVGEMVLYFSPGFVTGFSIEKQNIKVESQVVDRLVAVAAVPVGKFQPEQATVSTVSAMPTRPTGTPRCSQPNRSRRLRR